MPMNLRKIHFTYPGGLEKAYTMSYDDGNDCDIPLVEMMRKYGVKGTFNINSGCCPPERMEHTVHPWARLPLKELVDLYGDDMEIAVHGKIHPTWDRLPSPNAMQDILDDRRELERASGRIIRGAACPNGSYNDDVVDILRLAGFVYCRATGTTNVFKRLPTDWLRLQSTTRNTDPKCLELAEQFVRPHSPTGRLWLYYIYGHSYEFVRDDSWDVIETVLRTVSGRSDIWYATNIEIFDYLAAAKLVRFDIDMSRAYNPTDTEIWLKVTHGAEDVEYLPVPPAKEVLLPD